MNKKVFVLLVLVLSVSFVSAGWVGDLWGSITGNAVAVDGPVGYRPRACNVENILADDGRVAGLARGSRNGRTTIDGVYVTSCISMPFDGLKDLLGISVKYRTVNKICGDGCISGYCGKSGDGEVFVKVGDSYDHVCMLPKNWQWSTFDCPVNVNDVTEILICRDEGSYSRGNLAVDFVDYTEGLVSGGGGSGGSSSVPSSSGGTGGGSSSAGSTGSSPDAGSGGSSDDGSSTDFGASSGSGGSSGTGGAQTSDGSGVSSGGGGSSGVFSMDSYGEIVGGIVNDINDPNYFLDRCDDRVDGGRDEFVYGNISGISAIDDVTRRERAVKKSFYDYCVADHRNGPVDSCQGSPCGVYEHYCRNSSVSGRRVVDLNIINCRYGCSGSACLSQEGAVLAGNSDFVVDCSDSDGGVNRSLQGTAIGIKLSDYISEGAGALVSSGTDYCFYDTAEEEPIEHCDKLGCSIREYACTPFSSTDPSLLMVNSSTRCAYGCLSGACLAKDDFVTEDGRIIGPPENISCPDDVEVYADFENPDRFDFYGKQGEYKKVNPYGHGGNQYSNVEFVDGVVGSAAGLAGNKRSFVSIDAQALSGKENGTVSFWVKTDDKSMQAIFGAGYDDGARNNELTVFSRKKDLRVYFHGQRYTFPHPINDGEWHHVLLRFDSEAIENARLRRSWFRSSVVENISISLMDIFVDGEQLIHYSDGGEWPDGSGKMWSASYRPTKASQHSYPKVWAMAIALGQDFDRGDYRGAKDGMGFNWKRLDSRQSLNGAVDEFVVFNDVLSDSEVGELYQKGLNGEAVCRVGG